MGPPPEAGGGEGTASSGWLQAALPGQELGKKLAAGTPAKGGLPAGQRGGARAGGRMTGPSVPHPHVQDPLLRGPSLLQPDRM